MKSVWLANENVVRKSVWIAYEIIDRTIIGVFESMELARAAISVSCDITGRDRWQETAIKEFGVQQWGNS